MKKLIKLSENEIQLLNNILIDEKVNQKAKLKAKVILLRSEGKDISTIINETKISKRSIINYTNQYIKSSNKASFLHYRKYNQSELYKYKEELRIEFNKRPPITYKEATLRIEKLIGIKRSETQVRNFLNKIGIYTIKSRKKIRFIKRKKIKHRLKMQLQEIEKTK